MAHLLHIDSSIQGAGSVSRQLTERAAARWLSTHPDGTVTYRDLGTTPIPHVTAESAFAANLPPEQHTAAQAESYALTVELVNEIAAADTVILGLPLYNFGAPSSVKAWVDHLIAPGLSMDAQTQTGLLGDTEFIVLASRGGGYSPGTPREGWDHAEGWLPHGVSLTGLVPTFITAELTLAGSNPAMADLKPLAAESLRSAEQAIDELWAEQQQVA